MRSTVLFLRRLLAAGAILPAAIFGPAMGGVTAQAAVGKTAVSSDSRSLRVAAIAGGLSCTNATLCAEMLAPRLELRLTANPTAHAETAFWQTAPLSPVEAGVSPRAGAQDLCPEPSRICRAKVTLIEDVAVNACRLPTPRRTKKYVGVKRCQRRPVHHARSFRRTPQGH